MNINPTKWLLLLLFGCVTMPAFSQAPGTVKSYYRVDVAPGSPLSDSPLLWTYGSEGACMINDVDGDGNPEIMSLAYSSSGDRLLHQVRLNANGSPKPGQRYVNISKLPAGPWNTPTDFTGFGTRSIANMGDIDGNGVDDLAIGNWTGGDNETGEFNIFFMNSSGKIDSMKQLHTQPYALDTTILKGQYLGQGVANLGDLDGDGVNDLAVSQFRSNTIWIVLLTKRGFVKSRKRIYSGIDNFVTLAPVDALFGNVMTGVGDLDQDGVPDMMTISSDSDQRGSVWTLFLNADGSLKKTVRSRTGTGALDTVASRSGFGSSITTIGDIDGDDVPEVAVGEFLFRDASRTPIGRVHILFMNRDGTIKAKQHIDRNASNISTMGLNAYFGSTVFRMGDFNKDGILDLGATNPNESFTYSSSLSTKGICYILNLHGVPIKTGTGDIITNETKDYFAYPNPASDQLHVRGRVAGAQVRSLRVLDAAGRLVSETPAQQGQISIPVGTLPPGNYILQITGSTGAQQIRFTRQ